MRLTQYYKLCIVVIISLCVDNKAMSSAKVANSMLGVRGDISSKDVVKVGC